jgi:hypothetical protein
MLSSCYESQLNRSPGLFCRMQDRRNREEAERIWLAKKMSDLHKYRPGSREQKYELKKSQKEVLEEYEQEPHYPTEMSNYLVGYNFDEWLFNPEENQLMASGFQHIRYLNSFFSELAANDEVTESLWKRAETCIENIKVSSDGSIEDQKDL